MSDETTATNSSKPKKESKRPSIFFDRLRLRVLAILVGTGIAAFGVVAMVSAPAWPVIGVAVVTAAAMVSRATTSMTGQTCHACGDNLRGVPSGQYGSICPGCGAINQHIAKM